MLLGADPLGAGQAQGAARGLLLGSGLMVGDGVALQGDTPGDALSLVVTMTAAGSTTLALDDGAGPLRFVFN